MIGHTALSNSFSAFTRPVLAVGDLTVDSSQVHSAQDHAQSNPSTFAPIESLAETNQVLSRVPYEQSPSVLDEGNNVSEDAEAARESSKEAQEINAKAEKQALAQEQDVISQLAARDREVRAHEQAHAAVGGQYAGSPTYSFQRGPDGVRYAVGGEVSIDTGKAATPEETIRKAQVVRQAALAPAEPSPQDRRVAAEASQIQAEAVQELRTQQVEEKKQERDIKAENNDGGDEDVSNINVDSRQESLFLEDGVPTGDVSSDKSPDDKTINTGFTNTHNNIIGSRTYQSIANLAIAHRESHSVLDQII